MHLNMAITDDGQGDCWAADEETPIMALRSGLSSALRSGKGAR